MNDKCLKKVRGIFNPKVTDNLKPGVKELIGKEFIFEYLWIISKEDGLEKYIGQYAMRIIEPHVNIIPCTFSWTPEEDVDILEEV